MSHLQGLDFVQKSIEGLIFVFEQDDVFFVYGNTNKI